MNLSKSPRDWNLVPYTSASKPKLPKSRTSRTVAPKRSFSTTDDDLNLHISSPTDHFGLDISHPRIDYEAPSLRRHDCVYPAFDARLSLAEPRHTPFHPDSASISPIHVVIEPVAHHVEGNEEREKRDQGLLQRPGQGPRRCVELAPAAVGGLKGYR